MISFSAWLLIPTVPTIAALVMIFRPLSPRHGDYDFWTPLEGLLRLLWLIPVLVIWIIYLLVRLIVV